MKNRLLLALLIAWFCVGPLYVEAQPSVIAPPGSYVLPQATFITGAFAGLKNIPGLILGGGAPGSASCDAGDLFINSATRTISVCTTGGTTGTWATLNIATVSVTNANLAGPLVAGVIKAGNAGAITGNPSSGVGSPTFTVNVFSGTGIFVSVTGASNDITIGQVTGAYTRSKLGANTAVGTTSVTLLTQALTLPAVGGPFRIEIFFNVGYQSVGTVAVTSWATDGTVLGCGSDTETTVTQVVLGGGQGACVLSATYANGATPTILLKSVASTGSVVSATVNDNNNVVSVTWLETRVVPQ